MFNHTTLVLGGGSESHTHHHNTKVVEQRAPTDESIRLLQEMQDKALEFLIREPLEFNGIKCVMYTLREPILWDIKTIVKFDVNGKEHRVDVILESRLTQSERAAKVIEAVAREFAAAIIGPAFAAMPFEMRRTMLEGAPL